MNICSQCEKCCPGSGKLQGHLGRHRLTSVQNRKRKNKYNKERYQSKRNREATSRTAKV